MEKTDANTHEKLNETILKKLETNFTKIIVERDSKILLISDQHFSNDGESYFSEQAIKLTIDNITPLYSKINPDYIFILGDLFHGSQEHNDYFYELFPKLDSLGCPVFILSGNHDRKYYDNIDFMAYKQVRFIDDYFITVSFLYNQFQENIVYLTHDGGNGLWLTLEQKKEFLHTLRKTYTIPESSWLIAGHTHYPFVDYELKESSLGCFNFDSFKHHKTVLSFGLLSFPSEETEFRIFDLGPSEQLYTQDLIEKKINELVI